MSVRFQDAPRFSPARPTPFSPRPPTAGMPQFMQPQTQMFPQFDYSTYSGQMKEATGLSMPAIIAALGYFIVALVVILPFNIGVTDDYGNEQVLEYNFAQRFWILIMLTIPVILSVYSLNCMIMGQCVIWTNILSILVVVWAVMFLVSAYMYTSHVYNKSS